MQYYNLSKSFESCYTPIEYIILDAEVGDHFGTHQSNPWTERFDCDRLHPGNFKNTLFAKTQFHRNFHGVREH